MGASQRVPVYRPGRGLDPVKLAALREKINDEEYLYEAIHRIALILSNELLDIPQGGQNYEQRKGRR